MPFVDQKQRGEFFATHKGGMMGAGYHPTAHSSHLGMHAAPSFPAATHPLGQMGATHKLVTPPTPNYASLGNYLDKQKAF